ncbi:tartronate semialdehyde reductase [Blastococcus sp. DSM 46786]|uniref:NAD(P)-dependent oxidoreductase n=1 Tax=Blastococcus sp. DSM 46786 TaxID=1798227 RepID=UPI0008AD00AE|nr:NAD(P)-dependent oxidoreductase [Blastococcus sp. DSM 46786]SEK92102.1 tartronate semialdehyde reductase [Blastococcus sp. DSM 46786]
MVDPPLVAVIGLGAMGAPVVRHLLTGGVSVQVHDLDPAAVERAVARGARPVAALGDLARGAGLVAVFVPTDDDVRRVCLGEDGLLAGCAEGAVVLLCSSVRPETCQAVADAAPPGVAVLDAALTGGVRGAEAGEINLLVGGDAGVLSRIGPLLEPWTKAVHHLGPLGAGQVGKTANNLVHWAQISAITEALELARRGGVSVPLLRAALQDGPTDSRTLRELEQMHLTWHAKDLANTADLARRVGMDVPVAETARQVMAGTTVGDVARLLADGPLRAPGVV